MPAAGALAMLAGVAALCGTGPLDILLTNDDGASAAGIRALRAQLAAAGHRVTLVAPAHNASGTGMSFDWGPVRVTRDSADPSAYAVEGSPATAVVLGASALYTEGRRPDLVISGINHGPNKGALLLLSGTVGAALAGTLLLDPPVPGFAVNAERLHPAEPVDSPANRAQFEAVGDHFARLVGSTRGWFCEDDAVTRRRTVLNVNYPARPVNELRGSVVADQGSATDLRVTFSATGDGEYQANAKRVEVVDGRDSDHRWLALGYVTVTPVSGAIGDDSVARGALERRLRRPGRVPVHATSADSDLQSPHQR
jgi:5'-nucleotidase